MTLTVECFLGPDRVVTAAAVIPLVTSDKKPNKVLSECMCVCVFTVCVYTRGVCVCVWASGINRDRLGRSDLIHTLTPLSNGVAGPVRLDVWH